MKSVTPSSDLLAQQIQHLFIENKWSLSLAESCTGGAVAACLTRQAGASDYFLGSLVTYSNHLKHKLLHVPLKTLENHGAVSQETAEAMVIGLLATTGSDIGLAITGIAGPTGGSPEKPVGTVWISFCRKNNKPLSFKLQEHGNRVQIIDATLLKALQILAENQK